MDTDGDGCPDAYPLAVVGAGVGHACFLLRGGTSSCIGDTDDATTHPYNGGDAVSVAAGNGYTCYLLRDGTSTCRGGEAYVDQFAYGGGDAVAIAGGPTSVCYVLRNGNGQCMRPSGLALAYEGGDAITTATGLFGSCFILRDSGAYCETNGGDIRDDGGDVVAAAVGADHVCFLLNRGSSRCQGDNNYGQADAYEGADAVAISAREDKTCYLLRSGNAACFGRVNTGIQGVPVSETDRRPFHEYRARSAIGVAAGNWFTCWVLEEGTARCLGRFYNVGLGIFRVAGAIERGDLDDDDDGIPDLVDDFPLDPSAWRDNDHDGTDDDHDPDDDNDEVPDPLDACTLDYAWTSTPDTDFDGDGCQDEHPLPAVGVADDHMCVVLEDGNGHCSGSNNTGQSAPYVGGDAVAVSAHWATTCFLLEGGRSYCNGSEHSFSSDSYQGNDAVALNVGSNEPCYILVTGNVECLGRKWFDHSPHLGGDAVEVASAERHVCFLLANGNSRCFADEPRGNWTADYRGGDALKVVAGSYSTCYVLVNASISCLGVVGLPRHFDPGGRVVSIALGIGLCYVLDSGESGCRGLPDWSQDLSLAGAEASAVFASGEIMCYLLRSGDVQCLNALRDGQAFSYHGGDVQMGDRDDDNDGIPDVLDAYPKDPARTREGLVEEHIVVIDGMGSGDGLIREVKVSSGSERLDIHLRPIEKPTSIQALGGQAYNISVPYGAFRNMEVTFAGFDTAGHPPSSVGALRLGNGTQSDLALEYDQAAGTWTTTLSQEADFVFVLLQPDDEGRRGLTDRLLPGLSPAWIVLSTFGLAFFMRQHRRDAV